MSKYTARAIKNWNAFRIPPGTLDLPPARPENHKLEGWRVRIVLAWGVLTGKYDALDWEEHRDGQSK